MKKRLQKLKKHLPKKSTTSVESPAYVCVIGKLELVTQLVN